MRIQRLSNVVVEEAGLADVFPIHIFALKSSPPMGAQSAFRWWHERTFPTKSNSFHAAKPKGGKEGGSVFYAAAEKMQPPAVMKAL